MHLQIGVKQTGMQLCSDSWTVILEKFLMWRGRSNRRRTAESIRARCGAIIVYAAFLMVVVFGFAAFAIDVGYMALTVNELQNAADAAALAGCMRLSEGEDVVKQIAQDIAGRNFSGRQSISLPDSNVIIGVYNSATKEFNATKTKPNAVRVITQVSNRALFFAPVIGHANFNSQAEAIATFSPRDIVFCVDTSGSMNDDTEPAWASAAINATYGPTGYGSVGTDLVADLFQDLGFGSYPGSLEHVGQPLGVEQDYYAYANLTMDDGPLTLATVATQYRIANSDSEDQRKQKAYRWIIDAQIARLMPAAYPVPISSNSNSYQFWAKYLDYLIYPVTVGFNPTPPVEESGGGDGGSGGGSEGSSAPTPPPSGSLLQHKELIESLAKLSPWMTSPRSVGLIAGGPLSQLPQLLAAGEAITRSTTTYSDPEVGPGIPRNGSTSQVAVPPNQDWDRIYDFNNPNSSTFPTAPANYPWDYCNKVGYLTFVQYLLDFGRDRTPTVDNDSNADPSLTKTMLSVSEGSFCPRVTEATAGGVFAFPPREQPMHAVRRSLIAAIKLVQDRNQGLTAPWMDKVSLITFDDSSPYHAPSIKHSLTENYYAVMTAAANLQAVSDLGNSTAIENGLILARNHVKPPSQGGAGRTSANKVVILLTDGVPNNWQSSASTINGYISSHPSAEYYSGGYTWYNSVLMQAALMKSEKIKLFPVGTGLGTDYGFMDRVARLNGTAEGGSAPRGSGNPAVYEAVITKIFDKIIERPDVRIVQ